MINNLSEREGALEQMAYLQKWIDRLEKENPPPKKASTKLGIRKLITRINEELLAFEATMTMAQAHDYVLCHSKLEAPPLRAASSRRKSRTVARIQADPARGRQRKPHGQSGG